MSNICMIVPFRDDLGMTQFAKEAFRDVPDLRVMGTHTGLDQVESFSQLEYHLGPFLDKVRDVENEGNCDALIIGCFGDPGVDAVRQITSMPVVAPGETSLCVASMLGEKIAIVVPQRQLIHITEKLVRTTQFAGRVIRVDASQQDVTESVEQQPDELARRMIETCRGFVVDHGADVVVLGCIGFTWLVDRIREAFAREDIMTPVVDAGVAAYHAAKLLLATGLNHDRQKFTDRVWSQVDA
jgi:allantoin racemase